MTHVSAPTPLAAAHLLASSHTSLMHGWVPTTIQVVAAIVLTLAIGWGARRRGAGRPAPAGAVAVDRVDRRGRGGADRRLAQRAAVAARRDAARGALVLAQRGAGAQRVGWLLP